MYSFIVFKYVNLSLRKETIHFRENIFIFLGIWGEAGLILRIWGAKEKCFQRAEEFSFMDVGRSMHYFQRSREHRPCPLGASHVFGGVSFMHQNICFIDSYLNS